MRKQVAELRSQAAVAQARSLASKAVALPNGPKMLVARLDNIEAKALQVRLDTPRFPLEGDSSQQAVVPSGRPVSIGAELLSSLAIA